MQQVDAHQRRPQRIEPRSCILLELTLQGTPARVRVEVPPILLAPRQNRVRHHDLYWLSAFGGHEAGAQNAVARDHLLESRAQQRRIEPPLESELPLL